MSNNEQTPNSGASMASLPDLTRQTAKNGLLSHCNHEFNTEDKLKEHTQQGCKENDDNMSASLASNSDLALSKDSPKQSSSSETTNNNSRNETNSDSSNASVNNKARTISPMESAESGDESDNSEFITSPNENKKRKREEDDADISRAYKLRKKSMSMKEGLFSLLNQTHPDVDFTGDAIISWQPDGKSFVIHNWDRFVSTMNRICGQTFKALASNLSKFGFVRQKNKEQNLIQRHYLCPVGFERGGSNVDLKKITSKNKLGGSSPYPFDVPVPVGAFNPAILANPLLYKVQVPSPPLMPQGAAMEVNGFVPKELPVTVQPLSPILNGKPSLPYNSMIPNGVGPNHGTLPVGSTNLNNNINPNNSRDDLPWPKLISLDNKPTRVFTGPFDKRDEAFRINIYTLLTKKSNPACPEVTFTPTIQENCGDLYFTRLRGVPPDGLDWPTTPHTRVIYRTQTGRLQVGGSNQALQDGNVAVMRRHVWKSLCNRFKRHEYVLIDGQQKNKYWNVKEESPVLYCYFKVSDEEGNAPTPVHVPKLERPLMNGHDPEMIHFRVDNNAPTMANSYRSQVHMPNAVPYEAKMMDLDSIAEASVKLSQSPMSSSPAPRRIEIPHAPLPHGVPPPTMNGTPGSSSVGPAMNGGYSHPASPTPIMAASPQNSYPPSSAPKTFTLPFPGSKDPLPINNQMNGHPNGAILGANEVSNLLAMIENLKQQIKAMEAIKETQRINYEKQVFDLTLENQNLKKQLDMINSKLGQALNGFNAPMIDGMVPPRGFNPAILAALQQTAMAHNGGINGASAHHPTK